MEISRLKSVTTQGHVDRSVRIALRCSMHLLMLHYSGSTLTYSASAYLRSTVSQCNLGLLLGSSGTKNIYNPSRTSNCTIVNKENTQILSDKDETNTDCGYPGICLRCPGTACRYVTSNQYRWILLKLDRLPRSWCCFEQAER